MAYQKLQVSRALAVIPSNTINIPNPAVLSISSTTTGASAGKLIDSSQDFISEKVKIGDIVYSGTTAATVTAVDSATQLSVSTGIILGADYKLFSNDTPNNGCVLYIGGAAAGVVDVEVVTAAGDEVTFKSVSIGSFLPVQVIRLKAGTSGGADVLALW